MSGGNSTFPSGNSTFPIIPDGGGGDAVTTTTPTGLSDAALFGAWITFAIVSVAARNMAVVFPRIGLPLITGYLVVGAVAGPFVLGLIQKPALQPLSIITQFALAFISFSAGAELYLPELRALFKRILYATTNISVVTFFLCTAVITALGTPGAGILPWLEVLPLGCKASVASIAATIMVARSPASAIAVVKELKAKGIFTSTILGVTVLGDVYVLMLFTLTTTIAESECKGEGFSGASLGITVAVILVSILIGWLIGYVLLGLMNVKRLPLKYLILPLGLAIFVACHWFTDWSLENLPYVINLEPLLICITGGYVCTNRSSHRHRFISVLQQAGPYVFLPFFTLTGASLDLQVMIQSFGFAAIIAALRALCIFIGSSSGGYFAGVKPYTNDSNMLMWMCLLTQAGVSLGLASEVGMSFPEWGRAFQTSIIGVVLVNQIIGPVLFKLAVRKMGEAGKAAGNDEHDEDAVIPTALIIGDNTPDALAIASRLLSQRWNVTFVCRTQAEADAATISIKNYGTESRLAEKAAKNGDVVAGLKAGAESLVNSATGAANTIVAAIAGASALPTAAEEDHGHGAKKRPLEDGFVAIALQGGTSHAGGAATTTIATTTTTTNDVEVNIGAGAAVPTEGDAKYIPLCDLIPSTRALAAILYANSAAQGGDAENFSCARVVNAIIKAAPKRSFLHSVRQLTMLISPAWATTFQSLKVLPLHPGLAISHVAFSLLSAPRSRPVALIPAAGNNEEFAKNLVGGIVQGPSLWHLAGVDDNSKATASRAGTSSSNSSSFSSSGRSTSGSGSGGAPLATQTGTVVDAAISSAIIRRAGSQKSSSSSSSGPTRGNDGDGIKGNALSGRAEDVGDWAGARDEYLDALHGLDENADGSTTTTTTSSTSNNKKGSRGAIEDVAMFGYITSNSNGGGGGDEGNTSGDENEVAGADSGLATRDGNKNASASTNEWT